VFSSPAVANGVVYVGSDDHNVYAFNATTGAKLWDYTTGYWVYSSPAVANGFVYVGSDDGNIYAISNAAAVTSHATSNAAAGTAPGIDVVLIFAGLIFAGLAIAAYAVKRYRY
jgi:outer membrane protein assembly factor BamB